ncbi:MAG: hypothetical protein JWM11_6782 [Planctomycetaceae bacterium]|nr:hypothetical protein [Planctomycetaceae bacterium]
MRYDVVLKKLLAEDLTAWASLLGIEGTASLTLVDTGFQTVQATVDKLILVQGESSWLIHIEFQSGYHAKIGLRMVRYSGLIEHDMGLPVQSVLILLSPDADGFACTGIVERKLPFRKICYDEFRFDVVRLWEIPVELFLKGGLGTLALAPLCDLHEHELPEIVNTIKSRVDVEIPDAAERNEFWAAVEILMGAVYEAPFIKVLLDGVANMRESSTALAYIEEGRRKGLEQGIEQGIERGIEQGRENVRKMLIIIGSQSYGEPAASIRQRVEAIRDSATLVQLAERVSQFKSWDELLQAQ